MATKTTKKQDTQKKEFKLEQAFAMWKQKSKSGQFYFTGKNDKGEKLVGFFTTKKKNPKEPDARIYIQDGEELKEFCSLWAKVSKSGKTYLSGKLEDRWLVGFINTNAKEKQPYFSVYYQEMQEQEKPTGDFEQIPEGTDEELPF